MPPTSSTGTRLGHTGVRLRRDQEMGRAGLRQATKVDLVARVVHAPVGESLSATALERMNLEINGDTTRCASIDVLDPRVPRGAATSISRSRRLGAPPNASSVRRRGAAVGRALSRGSIPRHHILDEVERFVVQLGEIQAGLDRALATVLFTDVVGSTGKLSSWGSGVEGARRAAPSPRAGSARSLPGIEVDTAGDGFFATFDGPARAVHCATAIVDAIAPLGIEIRAGVHTGEVETIDGKVGGMAVVHRRPYRSAGRRLRGARLADRPGSRRGVGLVVRGRGRTRAEGRSRPHGASTGWSPSPVGYEGSGPRASR